MEGKEKRNKEEPPGFAPDTPTDYRKKGEWQSRYPKEANKIIIYEAIYLSILFISVLSFTFIVTTDLIAFLKIGSAYKKYIIAYLGGTFGGILFDIKWLYHSVAKNIWHMDRRLWRIFTPHLSGGLALVIVILISSGILNIFDEESLNTLSTAFGLGFLIGYFSDAAIGKLSEVAATFFGATEKQSHQK